MQGPKDKLPQGEPLAGVKLRNPHIENFCRALIFKFNEGELDGELVEKSMEKLYQLFEYTLGRKMIEFLPPEKREEYLKICGNLGDLNYERITEFFGEENMDYQDLLKETMKEVTELYIRNR